MSLFDSKNTMFSLSIPPPLGARIITSIANNMTILPLGTAPKLNVHWMFKIRSDLI